jgi:hypothetical protein
MASGAIRDQIRLQHSLRQDAEIRQRFGKIGQGRTYSDSAALLFLGGYARACNCFYGKCATMRPFAPIGHRIPACKITSLSLSPLGVLNDGLWWAQADFLPLETAPHRIGRSHGRQTRNGDRNRGRSYMGGIKTENGGSKPGSSPTPVLGRSENASPSRSPTPRAMSMLPADTPTTCNSIVFKTQ